MSISQRVGTSGGHRESSNDQPSTAAKTDSFISTCSTGHPLNVFKKEGRTKGQIRRILGRLSKSLKLHLNLKQLQHYSDMFSQLCAHGRGCKMVGGGGAGADAGRPGAGWGNRKFFPGSNFSGPRLDGGFIFWTLDVCPCLLSEHSFPVAQIKHQK